MTSWATPRRASASWTSVSGAVTRLVRQLLERVLELLEHFVHERPRDVEGGLDAQGPGVQQRSRHQDAALEEPGRHRVAELGVDELQPDEQPQPAHVLPMVREA